MISNTSTKSVILVHVCTKIFRNKKTISKTVNNNKPKQFLDNTLQKGIQWAQDSIMMFLDFHKERVRKKELVACIIKNYYPAAKLFC
ncbi:MAG TPA: hypothetical protein VJ729_17365 [Nitrososphaeraceae archaeon]|nr:hypothetical protein [Nitrososphaeraceae archaeon]